MAIQDDFPAYRASDWECDRSKLMMIDQQDYTTQHIFFDDNADESSETQTCIVDVRDLKTGEQIPYKQFIDKYVIKVQPHRAILEPDYFIKLIENAVKVRDQEIAVMII